MVARAFFETVAAGDLLGIDAESLRQDIHYHHANRVGGREVFTKQRLRFEDRCRPISLHLCSLGSNHVVLIDVEKLCSVSITIRVDDSAAGEFVPEQKFKRAIT